ncbi:MAG: hypothetical protein K0R73_3 [Candidatus Midichloriaceae bacterium]|jgi:hypothetical protein|nr:hypothetical protein [Candidatus Midichloriaceae bacterium]
MKTSIDENVQSQQNKKPRNLTLHEAVDLGYVEAVRKLLEDPNLNINELDDSGRSPLHYAAMKRNNLLHNYAMSNSFSLRDPSKESKTLESLKALKYYDEFGKYYYIEIAELLLKNGADPNILFVHAAPADLINLLLENIVENRVNPTFRVSPSLLETPTFYAFPLYHSCSGNDLLMTELLLKFGAYYNTKSDRGLPIHKVGFSAPCKGSSILYYSEAQNAKSIVMRLLDYGADLSLDQYSSSLGGPNLKDYLERIGFETIEKLPSSLTQVFPSTKYVEHAKFQLCGAIKTLGVFAVVSKSGLNLHLPEEVQFLIGGYCAGVSASVFAAAASIKLDESTTLEANTLETKASKVYQQLVARQESINTRAS